MTDYQYTNLSAALRDKLSPLRQLFDRRFLNVRPIQAEYRTAAGPLLIDGISAVNAGTAGAAFDILTRFRLDANYDVHLARAAFMSRQDRIDQVDAVIVAAQVAAAIGDTKGLARASWALALLIEVYRVGPMPGSPLADLFDAEAFTAAALLDLASEDVELQMAALDELAATELIPHLAKPVRLGPTFDGSHLCKADADLIAGGTLIDLKTKLGPKDRRTGVRSDRLDLIELYQVIAYALFDHSDHFGIRRVGIYSARYGHLVEWDLAELVRSLSGQPTDVAELREEVWGALGGK